MKEKPDLEKEKPPKVTARTNTGNRPLWSVMVPAYNSSELLPKTLKSILIQDPGADKMQIEVVDDASTEQGIEELVFKIGKGRIRYFKQEENVGSLKNFETCINRSEGHLVHLLHSDDKVKDGYYHKIGELFERFPQAGAAFSSFHYINENDNYLWGNDIESKNDELLQNWLFRIASKQRIQYCAITVKREVYEKLGGFYGVHYGEDWEMWARIAAHYQVAYTPQVLAEYRIHRNSISSRSFLNAQNIRDIKWVIDTIQQYLPENEKEAAKKNAYKHYAYYALGVANSLWHETHDKEATKLQIREALKMHTDLLMFYTISKIYAKMLINRR